MAKAPLPTKLSRPRLASVYTRTRLFRTLREAGRRPVVWISAPAATSRNESEMVINYSETTPVAYIVGSVRWSSIPMIQDYYNDPKVVVEDFAAELSSDVYPLGEDGTAFSGSESRHDDVSHTTHASWLRLTRE